MDPRSLVVVGAPTNLGLRPPSDGVEPGTRLAPAALRAAGLVEALGARDLGDVPAPSYEPGWTPGEGVRNAAGIAAYSRTLAAAIGGVLDSGAFPVVVGGDCSILLAAALALRERGRFGLAFVDGHSDFRHPGNAPACGAVAGEDLAVVTGRHDGSIDLPLTPALIRDEDVVVMGIRSDDEGTPDLRAAGIRTLDADALRAEPGIAHDARSYLERDDLAGFWIHLDVDVLDPTEMPAVDSPDPGGLDPRELVAVLNVLLASPRAAGLEITVFDPTLDPGGKLAALLREIARGAFVA